MFRLTSSHLKTTCVFASNSTSSLACSRDTVPWIIQCLWYVNYAWITAPSLKTNVLAWPKCLSNSFSITVKANGSCPLEQTHTDWRIVALVTTGVATGRRSIKSKDRVSDAPWAVLLGDQCDNVIRSALVAVIFKGFLSVPFSLAHTHTNLEMSWCCLNVWNIL